MRISDWSSDVCSSDLARPAWRRRIRRDRARRRSAGGVEAGARPVQRIYYARAGRGPGRIDFRLRRNRDPFLALYQRGGADAGRGQDRKSVGEGKSGSVRVDLGGRRTIKKKKTK